MRKLFIYMVIGLLCSCEVIREEDRLIPIPVEGRHVLIEYTGFRCVNCPTASETAQALAGLYGGQLIVVAMHPASNPFTRGAYDYTCPAADSVYQLMGGTATTPFPCGNIDLAKTDGDYLLDPLEWAGALTRRGAATHAPYLHAIATADTVTGRMEVACTTFSDSLTDCRLAIWLVEDSVDGVQAMPDGTVNMHYMHRHMLRGAADNQPFGTPVKLTRTAEVTTRNVQLPDGCNPAHCRIVALLLDNNDYHLLQAYETTVYFIANP